MTPSILGHEDAIAAFLSAMRGERPHHGWLFAGPEGVGKANLALQLARRVLAEAAGLMPAGHGLEVPEDHPVARYMESGAHPDFMLLERLPKDEKLLNKPREDWPDGYERARSIKVDQVRELTAKFATKPSLSPRRLVLIDAADDLETASANALLKALEEPPQGTIFILISHAPGRLLPTIRSRCRMLRFAALDDATMRSAVRLHHPDADPQELAALCALAQGAPGQALRHAGLKLAELDAALDAIQSGGDPKLEYRVPLAQTLSTKAAQPRYEAFLDMVPRRLADAARHAEGEQMALALDHWQAATGLARMAIPGSYDSYAIVMELCAHVAALAPARQGSAMNA